jgi:hypothetical protein
VPKGSLLWLTQLLDDVTSGPMDLRLFRCGTAHAGTRNRSRSHHPHAPLCGVRSCLSGVPGPTYA